MAITSNLTLSQLVGFFSRKRRAVFFILSTFLESIVSSGWPKSEFFLSFTSTKTRVFVSGSRATMSISPQ